MGSLVDWKEIHVGQCINTVLNVVCRDLEGVNTCHLCQSSDRQAAKIWVKGILPAGPSLCLLDVQVSAVGPVVLEVGSQSVVVSVPGCRLSDVTCVVELCSGLGAFSSGLSRLHLNAVAGVDENPVWKSLYTKLHGKHAQFIHGDIHSGDTLKRLVDEKYFHCIVAAGVHCQPFSRMGDGKGMLDNRSQSLPKALATSWILQAVIVLLECVPGVMSDAGFQGVLRQFVSQTGYKLTQVVLHLQDSWCSRRERWFGCLVAPIMSPISIPPMPKLGVCETIRTLFDVFPQVSAEDQKQIALNLYELSKYHAYALGGIAKQYVDLDAKAATVLHSLGNQMYHCACGCRPPLSEERLKQRGLVGALLKLGTSQVHCNVEMEHCRYWHPDEMWVLLGGMPDGVSQPDLLALPYEATQAFVDMYDGVESGCPWPQQVATGFITSLAKVATAQQVDAFRPVTVYSLVYCLWSSERAREALHQVCQWIPDSVQGGLPGRQAKTIWYAEAQALEVAHMQGAELNGLQMDIQNCFNAIPRMPLWWVLRQLDFPEHVLRAWASFVSGQSRRFRVHRSTGEAISSVCGLPEGCALSVFGMVVVDWMLDVWLRQLSPSPSLQAFVDDWSVMFPDHHEFEAIWQAVQAFTSSMDLTLDLHKTKVWSTTTEARKHFREGQLDVAFVSRVLGAHQNYTRHAWNAILQKRLQTLPGIWVKLRASLAPYKAKLLAIRMMGWPRAFHACSVVQIGSSHYQKARSGAMQGLRTQRKGANPCLHLVLQSLYGDPEARVIAQTFRDVRELGGERAESLLALHATEPADMPGNGPSAILASRISRVGRTVGGNGLVQDGLGVFSLLHTGWDEVFLRLCLSWGPVLAKEVGHRQSFAGIDQMDLQELHRALRPYGDLDLALLRCHLDGTLYTQNGRAKFQQGVESKCPWCQEKDGFYHRAWTCAYFEDCRDHMSPFSACIGADFAFLFVRAWVAGYPT